MERYGAMHGEARRLINSMSDDQRRELASEADRNLQITAGNNPDGVL